METSNLTSQKIEDFFIEKLNFRKSTSMKQSSSPKRTRTADAQDEEEGEYYDEEVESDSDLEMDEQQRAFMEFLEQKAIEDANFSIDFEEVLYTLNYDLPMIPGIPIVQQVNPRPYKDPIRVNFGKLMPKDKDAKGDKKAAKKKAPPKKAGKDEKPPKPIKWAPDKGPTPATALDLIRGAVNDLNESVFPKNIR